MVEARWVAFTCEGWEDAGPRAGRHTLPPPTPCAGRGQVPTLPLPALLALRLAWCVCPGVARGNSSCIGSPSRRGPRRHSPSAGALAHHVGFGQLGLRGQHEVRARTQVHHPGVQRRPEERLPAGSACRRRRSLSEPGPKMNSLVCAAGGVFSHHSSASSASPSRHHRYPPYPCPAQAPRGVQGTLPPPTPSRKCGHASLHPPQMNVTLQT